MKRILRFLLLGSLLLISMLVMGFLGLKYSWHFSDRKTQLQSFAKEVSDAATVPDSLITFFYADNQNRANISMTQELIGYGRVLLSNNFRFHHNSYSDDLIRYYFFTNEDRMNRSVFRKRAESISLGFGLESLVGTSLCTNYYVTKDFEETKRNIRGQPYSWVAKSISELTKEEFMEYVAVSKAPTLYSKFINPDNFARRVEAIRKRKEKLELVE